MRKVERWKVIWVQLLPALVTMLMLLISVTPLHVAGVTKMLFFLPLIALYYWGIFYPASLPLSFVFILGFVQDALIGTPLGLSSCINVVVMMLVGMLRRFMGKNIFSTLWLGFAAVMCAAYLLEWSIMSLYEGRLMSIATQFLPLVMTLLLYPWLHLLLSRVARA